MDVARQLLNNLMGRDRNKPKGDLSGRDHYSNRDVCKPYLICFCFNTLFPNTVYEDGPCNKRHDAYLKNMFDNDLNRKEYEREYIKECINWIEKRLVDVEQKIKKNQSVIETKTTFTGDRPKGILDRIIAIDADIEKMMKQAQIFGEQGMIDDSARCLQEVDRLRERRRQVESINDTTNSVQKQQKICEICGAIQTINDTEKRIQTHLEGKIHQGFLKLRHEVETLRVRLQILTQMDPKQKERREKEKQKQKEKEKEKEKQRERQKQREKERQKEREKERQKQKQQRQRQREKQRERERQRQRQKQKARQTEKDKYPDEGHHRPKNTQMIDEKDRRDDRRQDRSHSHKKKKDKDRERSRDKERKHKKQKQDKHRQRSREHRDQKKQKKKHKKDRSKSRSREKYPEREKRQHDREYER